MKTDIEYAALVMGRRVVVRNGQGLQINGGGLETGWWRPLGSDGDSRRLEIACLRWIWSDDREVPVAVWGAESHLEDARRAGSAEEYRAAVFALAVAIGKVIDGGGV